MLDLLHAVLRRDWPYLQDPRALEKLFPCTDSGLKNAAVHGKGLTAGDLEQLRSRSLFLRSVDAALECVLVFFGMESSVEPPTGVGEQLARGGRKLVYRFADIDEAVARSKATLGSSADEGGARSVLVLVLVLESLHSLSMQKQARALCDAMRLAGSGSVSANLAQHGGWAGLCARIDGMPA